MPLGVAFLTLARHNAKAPSMKQSNTSLITILKDAAAYFGSDKASRLAAALAFYTILALPPLLMLLIYAAGVFLGEQALQGNLAESIGKSVGEGAAEFISEMAANAASKGGSGAMKWVGIIGALFSVTGLLMQLQGALNDIWKVKSKANKGNPIIHFLKTRWLTLIVLFNVLVLILAGLALSAVLGLLNTRLAEVFPPSTMFLFSILNFLVGYALFFIIFAAIFKYIPDLRMGWRNVWAGALFTTVLFGVGRFLITFYFSKSDPSSAFGATGSLILLLLFIFYSAMILFFGAEFTKAWNIRKGYAYSLLPKPHATVDLTDVEYKA